MASKEVAGPSAKWHKHMSQACLRAKWTVCSLHVFMGRALSSQGCQLENAGSPKSCG